MPYIDRESRTMLADMNSYAAETAGELNYVISILCFEYFQAMGGRYQHINDILGALEGAKLEFYRRIAAPYEDKKIAENGDVFN